MKDRRKNYKTLENLVNSEIRQSRLEDKRQNLKKEKRNKTKNSMAKRSRD